MAGRNLLSRVRSWYAERYVMPIDCRKECARRNIRRISRILPITLLFGLCMTVLSVMSRGPDESRLKIAIAYYSSYITFSAIPLALFFVFRKRGERDIAWQNALCYAVVLAFQCLCLYQKTISRYQSEGYIAWTIVNLTVIALVNIRPSFYLVCSLLQFSAAIIYESAHGKGQFLNLGLLVSILIILDYTLWNLTIRDFRNMAALREANAKSDELLHNLLPPRVVNDLRRKGTSSPELFEQVSILFTDLVNFTEISSSLEPEYLIGELSDLFCGFDFIIEKYGCTRIKTIGDAYMAVCGLPENDPEHARKIVQAGLECMEYLKTRNEHSPIKWKMRVGVHSGSVVAGIVGVRKYIYDIFGDTVNTASRMESSSNEMEVNVSEATYLLTRDSFEYEPREPQCVKGKGFMTMYFAHQPLPGELQEV